VESPKRQELSRWIKKRAESLGFAVCGIAKADYLEEDDERFYQWLQRDYQAGMRFMERYRDIRPDPRKLLPGARSVIVVLMNYFPSEPLHLANNYKIAKYAYGRDYHLVIREKLNQLTVELKEIAGDFQVRAFTDSAPVLERAWAQKAGLGWIGKNTCLIHPGMGSFVFIGEIITDMDLAYDQQQVNDLCGGCTRCIDACPTGAICAPRLLDAGKCISYYTIEHRNDLPADLSGKFQDWIFGCDICQDVCPWNRKAQPHGEEMFKPAKELVDMDKEKWERLTGQQFKALFMESAVLRTKFSGLKRNIHFLKNKDLKSQ
jgi:epoxyqueuosine reductase